MDENPETARGPRTDPETTRLQRQVDELTALLGIAKRLRRPFDLDDLLDEIVAISRDALRAEACSLLKADPAKRLLYFHSARGGQEERIMSYGALPYGKGIAGWVAEHRESALVNEAAHDPRFQRDIDREMGFQTRAVLAVPILSDDGELLGVIEVLNKKDRRPFNENDRTFFQAMAEHAGAAIRHVEREARRREEVRLATIGTMASSIIHDIKNPMAAIKGFAQLLANRSPDNRRYAEIIIREIDRLVGMTQELLDFSKGVQNVDVEELDLPEFVQDIAGFLERDFEGAGIELSTDLVYRGKVELDRHKVRRAIFNLASNARDAMPRGGRFRIATAVEGDDVVFLLSDTGCGMPPEILARVFHPFFTTKEGRGTGLGTSIVRSVMEAHGGRVEVVSSPGEGTTFRLVFPRKSPLKNQ
ncbi:MAG: GAF domain-containing protein [Planctomycetes bacterium]|nr:GAF domain-containing protein [Planctomycetota bacterium]